MATDDDWYPSSRPLQRIMFGNVKAKYREYETPYGLTEANVERVELICDTFIEVFDKIEYNRATGRQATEWFKNILEGEPRGSLAPAPPTYVTITLPIGAFIGLEKEFRELMKFFKANSAYTQADGEDLMIVAPEKEEENLLEAMPELSLTVSSSNVVTVTWKKGSFDSLELQYRKADAPMWQFADKSTEREIDFTPPLTTPGIPEKFEFRGVFVQKNERVGQWSPTYTTTVG